jgi:nucleoside-diphosphate-sugar epimerase
LPIPIPGDGTQMVSLTNSKDVASLLTAPLNNEAAAIAQRYFNCGTDRLYSYDRVAELCAQTVGCECNIEHYDSDLFGKANFPFRMTNFYVAPDMAKEKLGWCGAEHDLKDDLGWYLDGYKARGGPEKYISLVKDWEIVVGCKTYMPTDLYSIYDEYDPLPFEVIERKGE